MFRAQLIFALVIAWLLLARSVSGLENEAGSRIREAWTTSRLVGSPEPPLPYVLNRVFPHLGFKSPISIHQMPDRPRLIVCERGGKVFSFADDLADAQAELMADFSITTPPFAGHQPGEKPNLSLFSLAFHPQFKTNRLVVVCYVRSTGPRTTNGTRVSSFQVTDATPPQLDIHSETLLFTCDSGGHNGCTVAFGNDGLLYISMGDLTDPTPPDILETGQDLSDVFASILRIDVDQPQDDRNYSIPPDNPFISFSGARPEIYAYGFRNPFRMSFDRATGDLWVGDVGWESWEMVYRVVSGGNYGWSIMEGPAEIKAQAARGPTPIRMPDVALSHSEAASVTGGVVYRGDRLPKLHGRYVFGDWTTRKFWSVGFNAEKVDDVREIASGHVKPICFELDRHGELLILDYAESDQSVGIYRFADNPKLGDTATNSFPRRLSETGLFVDLAQQVPARGVASYSVNLPMWMEGATAEYLLAIPGTDQATYFQKPQPTFDWFTTNITYPKGTVQAKTYSIPGGDSATARIRIETQISICEGLGEWQYYTYRWNNAQTDADLVDAVGATTDLTLRRAAAAPQTISWVFAGRSQCRTCHSPWVGESLSMLEEQLRRPAEASDSWRRLIEGGFLARGDKDSERAGDLCRPFAVPDDANAELDLRARSYLHVNCAHCHRMGGNASTAFDVRFDRKLSETKALDIAPMKGDCQLPDARIIAPGSPTRSVLLYRMAKLGSGRMPHIGSQTIDAAGLRLIWDWISATSPDRAEQHIDQDISEAKVLATAEKLLDTVEGSVRLAWLFADDKIPAHLVGQIVDRSLARPDAIRELIEPYARSDQRIQRLGAQFKVDQLLAVDGDGLRGEHLFRSGVGQCVQCHRVGATGKETGPNLNQVGTKLKTREKILASIMHPSSEIADEFRALSIITESGQSYVGRVMHRSESEVVIQEATGKTHVLPLSEIEIEKPNPQSMMPEQLLNGLTLQQAADLLAFLGACK